MSQVIVETEFQTEQKNMKLFDFLDFLSQNQSVNKVYDIQKKKTKPNFSINDMEWIIKLDLNQSNDDLILQKIYQKHIS